MHYRGMPTIGKHADMVPVQDGCHNGSRLGIDVVLRGCGPKDCIKLEAQVSGTRCPPCEPASAPMLRHKVGKTGVPGGMHVKCQAV